MSSSQSWNERLLGAARRRAISFTDDETERIRSAPVDSEVSEWARAALLDRDLLSGEELNLWNSIKRQRRYSTTHNDTSTKVLSSENELISATNAFEQSTAAIEEHTRVLESQLRCVEALQSQESAFSSRCSTSHQQQSQKWIAEVEYVTQKIREKHSELSGSISDLDACTEKAAKAARAILPEHLSANDRAFERMQSLHSSGAVSRIDLSHETANADLLSKALRRFQVDLLKDRLDRVYLENLNAQESKSHPPAVSVEKRVLELNNDVRTLYNEIEDVAMMLVSTEFTKPLISELEAISKLQDRAINATMKQTQSNLARLTQSLTDMRGIFELLHSDRLVLRRLSSRLNSVQSEYTRQELCNTADERQNSLLLGEATKVLRQQLELDTDLPCAKPHKAKSDERLFGANHTHELALAKLEDIAQHRRSEIQLLLDATEPSPSEVQSKIGNLDFRVTKVKGDLEEFAMRLP